MYKGSVRFIIYVVWNFMKSRIIIMIMVYFISRFIDKLVRWVVVYLFCLNVMVVVKVLLKFLLNCFIIVNVFFVYILECSDGCICVVIKIDFLLFRNVILLWGVVKLCFIVVMFFICK